MNSPAPAAQPAEAPPAATVAAEPTEEPARPSAEEIARRREQGMAAAQPLIAGRETQPAETVFKNIQIFKGVPAERVLRAMNGWSNALGVSCDFCHVREGWELDTNEHKRIARGMVGLTRTVNTDLLKTIPDIDADASVSCYTCHRGQVTPATSPGAPAAAR